MSVSLLFFNPPRSPLSLSPLFFPQHDRDLPRWPAAASLLPPHRRWPPSPSRCGGARAPSFAGRRPLLPAASPLPLPLWPEAMAGHGPSMTVAALAVCIPAGRICHGIDEQKLIAGRRAGGPSERRRRAAAGGGDGATSSSGHGARLSSSSSSLAGAPHLRPPSLLSPSATAPLLPGTLRYFLSRGHLRRPALRP